MYFVENTPLHILKRIFFNHHMKKYIFIYLFIFIINIYAEIDIDWKKFESGVYYLNEKEKSSKLYFLVVGRSSSILNIDESTAYENARMEALKQYIDYINKLFFKVINEKKYSKLIEAAFKNKKITENEFTEYNNLFDFIINELNDSFVVMQFSAMVENDRYAFYNNNRYEAVISYYADNNFLLIMNKLLDKKISNKTKNSDLVLQVKKEINNNLKEIILNKKFY